MPVFGGGLKLLRPCRALGQRTTPLKSSAVELPPNERPALQIIARCLERKTRCRRPLRNAVRLGATRAQRFAAWAAFFFFFAGSLGRDLPNEPW